MQLERCELVVRGGKGGNDRVTMIPQALLAPLREQLEVVRIQHTRDLEFGRGWLELPGRVARKYPHAGRLDLTWERGAGAPNFNQGSQFSANLTLTY